MQKIIKIIYSLVQVLPLVGELLEILARKQENPDSFNRVKSDKDIVDNI